MKILKNKKQLMVQKSIYTRVAFLALFFMVSVHVFSQAEKESRQKNRAKEVGEFQLGMRSTVSLFDHKGFPGLGYGGMFRIRPGKRINTEWYCDYIKTDISGLGYRETVHIGWSVMIYPFKTETAKGKFTPYFIGGNCFDYGKIESNLFFSEGEKAPVSESSTRITTSVQGGLGVNYHFSNKFNLSLSAQYMEHIGKEIHAEVIDEKGEEVLDRSRYRDEGNRLHIESGKDDVILSGHLLLTLSLNITLFDIAK
jgi:hypothetical protein